MASRSYTGGGACKGNRVVGRKRLSSLNFHLSIVLILFCFLFSGTAWGQKALPYSYGFENNNLTGEGWTTYNCNSSSTGIYNDYDAHTGSYLFRFYYGESDAYLISPELTGTGSGVDVSFYYKNYSSYYTEQFQVGYTTISNNTDPSTYTYGSTIYGENDWEEYSNTFPAGTKRIAIKYIYTNGYYLYLDDFSFATPASCPKPAGLVLSTDGATMTATWNANVSAIDYNVSINGTVYPNATSSNSYTFDVNLSTNYTVMVEANCAGSETSGYCDPVSLTTPDCIGGHTIEYTLTDSYNDGWEGSSIRIVDGCGNTIQTLTVASGDSPLSGTLTLCGSYYEFVYTQGNYPSEYGWTFTEGASTLFSGNGNDFNTGDVLHTLGTFVPAPSILTAGAPGTNSVVLNWSENGTASSWQICINGDENNLITANTNVNYTLSGLNIDTDYAVKVRAYIDANTQSCWSNIVRFTTEASNCPKPINVTASNLTVNSANISWNGNADSYTVRYRTATVTGTTLDPVFEDGFESGLGSWTIYINGYQSTAVSEFNITDWHQMGSNSSANPHTGSYMAMSRSYDGSDRTVDNWLVSPQMVLGDVLTFWVIDDGTWHEHLEVWVSTETNAIGDFEKLTNISDATSSWTMKTVDLSAYAGQTGYIAIRHNDAGKDWVFIDDFGVYNTVNAYSYGTATTITPATSPCNIAGLSAETLYEVSVQADCGGDGTSGWSSIYFTTPDACSAPTDLVSSNITSTTAALGWADNQDSYNLRYRKVYFYEDFEGETLPTGWTTIDANEDGNTWSIGHSTTHSGNNGAYNLSYIYSSDNSINTTPNDWLVSPQLDLQGTLRVWLSGYARSSSNYSEHFEILISTTGNSVSDFTTTLVAETTTGDTYVEYTADLSSYAGQQGYIAIHHFNCTDQYYLYVDDFGLYGSENWVSVSPNPTDAAATLIGLSAGTDYEWQVQGLSCNNNGDNTAWSAPSNFTTLYPTKIRNTSPAADEMTWEQFANFVNKGHSYSGETVTLMENISVSAASYTKLAGTQTKPFSGTFDGDGKTIDVSIDLRGQGETNGQGAAPFRSISNATIMDLKVTGTVNADQHHAAGLVGWAADNSTNTIRNCFVGASVTNGNSGVNNNNFIGGLIGHNKNATTSIIGCVYTGTLKSQAFKGGMFGFADAANGTTATINLTDSYFAGGYDTNGHENGSFSPIGCRSTHSFTLALNLSNFYFNENDGSFQADHTNYNASTNSSRSGEAKFAYTVTGATDVTVAMRGDYTHYDVSDIYGYSTGIVYNGTIIGGNADNLSLNLGYTGTGSCSGYVADYGELSGSAYSRENDPYTLTMPNSNVEISVKPGTVSVEGSAVCSGRASTLTATTVGFNNPQFTWTASSSNAGLVSQNAGEISVTPTAGDTYTYTCSVTEGNDATVISDNIELTMKQSPTGLAITGDDAVCFGLTSALSASCSDNNATYSWNGGAGAGSSWTTPAITTSTNIVVVATSANGCAVEENMTVTPKVPTSSEISAMGATDGCLIWTGNSENWTDDDNWMLYSGGTYTLASAPTSLSNVVIGSYSDCVSTPTLNVNTSASVNTLRIASEITVSGENTLSMDGNLVNNGTFNAPVRFNGNSTLSGSGTTTFRDITIAGTFNASSASLTVSGDWTNNGTFTANGPVVFAGASAQNIAGNNATTFNNVTFSNANGISISKEPTINGTATFTSGVVTGNVTFGSSAKVSGASTSSHVDGIVKKNGAAKSTDFYFPTGSNGNLGKVVVTDGTATNVSVQYFSNPAGFSANDLPRWWASASVSGFDHVSNVEYWKISSTDTITANFVAEASTDMHFNSGTAEEDKIPTNIQMAFYDNNRWTNVGGSASIGNNMLTITGAVIPASTTRGISGNYTTFGSKTASTVLPIELTSFTATCDGRSALVEWATATERNNDYFSLERSDDAINFTEIARVAGAGNSIEPIDYSYTDYGIHGGDNYYRLVQVDYDGTRTASDIVVANCIESEVSEPEIMAYPNPFSSELTVVLDNFGNRAATIEVYDMLGKLIYTEKASAPQNSYETILNLSNLPSGAYTVRVSTTDFVINKNVVKQ